mgnify:CR=1 FL=1
MGKQFFSSESVTEGHPDKLCDQIADAILDAILEQDPLARVACEVVANTGLIYILGEISTLAKTDVSDIARKVIKEVGYNSTEVGFDYKTCGIITSIKKQSADIALGVNKGGAGDQGQMIGYACNETPELMPLPISLSHSLVKELDKLRHIKKIPYLRPDGKSQVTVEYREGRPYRVDAVVISAQHDPNISYDVIQRDIKSEIIYRIIPEKLIDESTKIYINPTGRFVTGGPMGDSGLTGRKIIVDTYGGVSSHGGGAFSGKDPSKVDRSAAYAARWIAKNIIASKLAEKCEIQLSYAIGIEEPISVYVNTFGTGVKTDTEIVEIINKVFKLGVSDIITELDLRRPIYRELARYGHMGRNDLDVPWERTNKVSELVKIML